MDRYGSELIFISRISGTGKHIEILQNDKTERFTNDEKFELNSLSISNGTYIASGMSSYVVRLKNPPRK